MQKQKGKSKMAEQKLILEYELDKAKAEQLAQLCKRLKLRTKPVVKAFYTQPIGFLAGIPGWKKSSSRYEGIELGEEMLIFYGFESETLDDFLTQYREANIFPVSLKAVVTEHNVSWNSVELFQELQRERKEFESQTT